MPLETGKAALRIPLYHQIFLIIRQKIMDGVYSYDERLPGELDLIRQHAVSRITAKRALDELALEGMVIRERGRGTRVRYRTAASPLQSTTEGLLDNLQTMGLETQADLLEFDYVSASQEVAAALECRVDQTVQRAVRIRLMEGMPFSHLTTHVPEAVGKKFKSEELAVNPMLSLLERSGVVVSGATQTLSATLADAKIALALGVEVGSALLKLRRIVRDEQQRPVEFLTALYRPDQYQYRMVISRVQGEARNGWSTKSENLGQGPV